MQKKIIALAVAGLVSGAAFAQTNVTIYGVVDLGQAWVKGKADGNNQDQKTVGRLDNNSSHIGFKGVEDLGNGLKAVFQIESGVNPDSTGGNWASRDSFIGLAGGFGTIAAGTLTHPLRAMGAKVDIMPGWAGFGTTSSVTGRIAGVKTGADDRASNAVAYISPSFGGFTVIGAYVNGEQRDRADLEPNPPGPGGGPDGVLDDKVNANAWQIAAQYDNGPLFVGIGYHKTRDSVQTGNAAQLVAEEMDARVWRVAAAYTAPFGTKFSALYDNTKVECFTGCYTLSNYGAPLDVKGPDLKRSAWSVAVAHTFGANTVGLQYGRSGETDISGGPDGDDKATIWSALYTYSLSKRTMVHARYSRLSNDDGGNFHFYNNQVENGIDAGAGSTYSGFMVGLRHSF
ncbi:MAG: porin [Azonexus sp.]|jgi:predicted porin|nr:porin [Azonexus sp.]